MPQSNDVLIACTDGLWSGLEDDDLSQLMADTGRSLEDALRELAERSVAKCAPHSDNTSAAALRWLG